MSGKVSEAGEIRNPKSEARSPKPEAKNRAELPGSCENETGSQTITACPTSKTICQRTSARLREYNTEYGRTARDPGTITEKSGFASDKFRLARIGSVWFGSERGPPEAIRSCRHLG